ncbi:hypothetical protein Y1Q_0020503 [Alligator mississippiensis]|uniref:Uncharacterized protein n=1 Tax=Alligator mississippiensis TaxID=8496 RepID=A0A151MZ20_ALLMI|nr:hypothetical protein Y1Q_0020503 [Alligator mississippiensis]
MLIITRLVPKSPGHRDVEERSSSQTAQLPPVEAQQGTGNPQPPPASSKGTMRARMYWDPAEEELLRCQEPWDKTRGVRRQLFRLGREWRQQSIRLQQLELVIGRREQCQKKCSRDEGQLSIRGRSQKDAFSMAGPSAFLKKSRFPSLKQ